uniref:Serine/threonine protein kinase n=1 Tax=Parastrongyloides trichosuri TaxID=131310 RepID=A0A0N4Z2Z3_PARTI
MLDQNLCTRSAAVMDKPSKDADETGADADSSPSVSPAALAKAERAAHAGLVQRSGAASGAHGERQGLPAGRLHHRRAAGRPAPSGPDGHGCGDRAGRGLCQRHRAQGSARGRDRVSLRVGGRDRARLAGRRAGGRDDGAEERRARAGSGRPGQLPQRHGRQDRGAGYGRADDHRGLVPVGRDLVGNSRSNRDGLLCPGRGDGRGRGASDQGSRRADHRPDRQDGRGGRRDRTDAGRPDRPSRPDAAAEGRQRHDRDLSGLRHRPAGAVHGADDDGRGRERDQRNDLREPFHARAGTGAPGRGHHRPCGRGRGARRRGAEGRAGHGDRSSRLHVSGHRRSCGRRRCGRKPGADDAPSPAGRGCGRPADHLGRASGRHHASGRHPLGEGGAAPDRRPVTLLLGMRRHARHGGHAVRRRPGGQEPPPAASARGCAGAVGARLPADRGAGRSGDDDVRGRRGSADRRGVSGCGADRPV